MVLVRTQFIFLGRRQDARHPKGLCYRFGSTLPASAPVTVGLPTNRSRRMVSTATWAREAQRPTARFRDLGADYHTTWINTERRTRNYVTQLMAMGYRVTLEPAA